MRTLFVALLASCATDPTPGPIENVSTAAPPAGAIYDEPPPPRVEEVVHRPGFVWIEGRWIHAGHQWVWVNGRYERERAGYAWQPGRWERRGAAFVWVEGSWTASGR